LEVLERDRALDDSHGAHRLAILFLGVNGIAAYKALFCQENGTPPFAIVLQDHGTGGNYDRFGHGGSLERIAKTYDVIPYNGLLMMIGADGLYQYDYSNLQSIEQVSFIPVNK
jgi:hypothetical protein